MAPSRRKRSRPPTVECGVGLFQLLFTASHNSVVVVVVVLTSLGVSSIGSSPSVRLKEVRSGTGSMQIRTCLAGIQRPGQSADDLICCVHSPVSTSIGACAVE